jgi:hypothetical protein
VEGCGHGLLDFCVLIKALYNLQVAVTEGFEDQWSRASSLVTWRRRFAGGPGFEMMRVASWHIQTPPHHTLMYIWASLSSFALQYGGQAVPYPWCGPQLYFIQGGINVSRRPGCSPKSS